MLFLDFETKDNYLSRKLGAGWVYALPGRANVHGFKVLGMAYHYTATGTTGYETDLVKIREWVQNVIKFGHTLIMHNATYDLGCLEVLGVDTTHAKVYCTKIAARLFDSSLESYSLAPLTKRYTNIRKETDLLVDGVWQNDLYPWKKYELKAFDKSGWVNRQSWALEHRKRPEDKVILAWAYKNMDILADKIPITVAEYAKADIEATMAVYNHIEPTIKLEDYAQFFKLSQIVNSYRTRGIPVDLPLARDYHAMLMGETAQAYKKVYDLVGHTFNLRSSADMSGILDAMNIPYPKTDKGNPSITTPWMDKQDHPFLKAVMETKKLLKIDHDFIQKIIELQDDIQEDEAVVYPELNALGARTGRFSSSNPNLQQIPSKGRLGDWCRDIYCAYPGDTMYSLDYANQEGRLQVHYAYLLGCEGASLLRQEFINNPRLDMHQIIADMIGIERDEAKAINLGISYGMGKAKLANQLGVSVSKAKYITDKYHDQVPFLIQLNTKCKESLADRGWIKTIGGRKLKIDKPVIIDGERKTFEYKALNKLIQGSAADQIIKAMNLCYEAGIKVMMPIHDQLIISGTQQDAIQAKEFMETAYTLEVPTVVDVDLEGGSSWAEAGH